MLVEFVNGQLPWRKIKDKEQVFIELSIWGSLLHLHLFLVHWINPLNLWLTHFSLCNKLQIQIPPWWVTESSFRKFSMPAMESGTLAAILFGVPGLVTPEELSKLICFEPGRSDEGEIWPPSPPEAFAVGTAPVLGARPAAGVRRHAGLRHADGALGEVLQETRHKGHRCLRLGEGGELLFYGYIVVILRLTFYYLMNNSMLFYDKVAVLLQRNGCCISLLKWNYKQIY